MANSPRAELSPRTLEPAIAEQVVKTIKGLSMDGVQAANSGHPGMPMGCADMATVLWTEFLVHDPSDPTWFNRDRFVLSAGHGSMLLYSLLHLTGYELSLDELRNFRQWGSKTAGHPEYGHTPGVDITTGPLGSGFASGVGMAMAERFLADRYNTPEQPVVDHFTYGIVSDGDLMEGIAAEAASLAGHLGLGKLVYLYDDNHISIDGGTEISFGEDVQARFAAYGWHVLAVDGHDRAAVREALITARAEGQRPSLICCRTTIGQGAPTKAGTSGAHGAPLGAEEVAATKQGMDWPLEPTFHVPGEVSDALGTQRPQLQALRDSWNTVASAHAQGAPLGREFSTLMVEDLPAQVFEGFEELLGSFEVGKSIATRKVSHKVICKLADNHPTFLGGSADLAGSNGVLIPNTESHSREVPQGRNIHFGVREHAMGAICNGMALHGGLRVFDATFLVFSDFMRGALRLSALMGLPVVHVFTHDSFYLGEDGPTHQPIEHAMSLRVMPGLNVFRPGDARETIGAWKQAMLRTDGPSALLLTRQGLPTLAESSADSVAQGGYVLWDEGEGETEGIFIATGSELSLALEAAKKLGESGTRIRVVSMPCWELFAAQDAAYRDSVLPSTIGRERRVAIEAGATLGWERYADHVIGIDRFGASAPAKVLAQQFGFSVDAVLARWAAVL